MNNKTRNIVLASLLTALSVLITFSFKLPVPQPFSLTPGSHVPTMIALFINPFVTVLTVVGSCFGFLISTGNPVVILRAASHIFFALLGMYMIKEKHMNIFIVIIVTSIIHAGGEALVTYFLTPILLPDNKTALTTLTWFAFIGTLVHHYLDSLITAPVLYALQKAKMIHTDIQWKAMLGVRGVER